MIHSLTTALKYAEYIFLNIASFGFIYLDVAVDNVQAEIKAIPTWVSILVGLSIVTFNLARAYKAYKEGRQAGK